MVRAQASLGSQTPIQMHPQLVPASLLVLSILPGTWLACGSWKGCEGRPWFTPAHWVVNPGCLGAGASGNPAGHLLPEKSPTAFQEHSNPKQSVFLSPSLEWSKNIPSLGLVKARPPLGGRGASSPTCLGWIRARNKLHK